VSDRGSDLKRTLLESRYFGPILGLAIFLLVSWLAFLSPSFLFQWWDRSLGDVFFQLRTALVPQALQEGVVVKAEDNRINPDILILGVDDKSLDTLGKWPFSRSVHADLLNSFTRVQAQEQRERSVFLDFFFLDKDPVAENDLAFVQAMAANQRTFLETVYSAEPMDAESAAVQFRRLEVLQGRSGSLGQVTGDAKTLPAFLTVKAPLIPLGQHAAGQGFATFSPDQDQVFRRQSLIAKVAQVVAEYDIAVLKPDVSDYDAARQRYVYTNKAGVQVTLPAPLTEAVVRALPELLARDGLVRQVEVQGSTDLHETYFVQKVQDILMPSMPLALALDYWHKKPADITVVLGSHILVPSPKLFDPESAQWTPAPYGDVRIPIDSEGAMAINFMGPRSSANGAEYQTFPVRSYSSAATKAPSSDPATWPESRQLANRVVMVGAFSSGMVDDEKNTPYGQMFGVEMHANALNTLLTRNFLVPVPTWIAEVVLLLSILAVAFLAGRFSTLLSLLVTVLWLLGAFVGALVLFDTSSIVYPFSSLLAGTATTFLLVVVYRALTEEREKRKVRTIFSKYVSPDVVTQLLRYPPELGGVDKELTVLFSDIRGFTSLSEVMTPQELVHHLNEYLTAMTDIIHEYRGTLDKYVGDEIMCFWGAPLDQPDHAVLASQCALKMMEVLKQMNARWAEDRQINIGIGLNSGIMTVGNMGSQGRMNYTLMGDNVNLGARLEGTNKEYLTNIIISEATYHLLEGKAVVRELDNIRVKGKNRPVLIFELLDFVDGIEPAAAPHK
jgi:adenylate cyclase